MSGDYTITNTSGTVLGTVYMLEVNGPNGESVPRQILTIPDPNTITISGDMTYRFVTGFTFTIQNSNGAVNDGTFTVGATGSTESGGITTIDVAETLTVSGAPLGDIVYSVPANEIISDLDLVGRGSINFGQYFANDSIRNLEHFASITAPSNPIGGQLWYDKSTESLSTIGTFNVYNDISGTWFQVASSPSVLDTTYLRLDATNDPVTGALALNSTLDVQDDVTISKGSGARLVIRTETVGNAPATVMYNVQNDPGVAGNIGLLSYSIMAYEPADSIVFAGSTDGIARTQDFLILNSTEDYLASGTPTGTTYSAMVMDEQQIMVKAASGGAVRIYGTGTTTPFGSAPGIVMYNPFNDPTLPGPDPSAQSSYTILSPRDGYVLKIEGSLTDTMTSLNGPTTYFAIKQDGIVELGSTVGSNDGGVEVHGSAGVDMLLNPLVGIEQKLNFTFGEYTNDEGTPYGWQINEFTRPTVASIGNNWSSENDTSLYPIMTGSAPFSVQPVRDIGPSLGIAPKSLIIVYIRVGWSNGGIAYPITGQYNVSIVGGGTSIATPLTQAMDYQTNSGNDDVFFMATFRGITNGFIQLQLMATHNTPSTTYNLKGIDYTIINLQNGFNGI